MITIRQTSVAASALLLLSACHPGGEENPEEIAAQRSRALATRDVRLVQPEVREEYLERLERIRKGGFIKVEDFAKRYGLEG